MADQLMQFKADVEKLTKAGDSEKLAIVTVLKKYLKTSKRILFEGNGYGDEWVAEALDRGLSNVKTTPNALDAYISKQSKKLFVNNGIFTERELEARHEIMLETYVKKIQIESRVIGEMATTQIIPSAVSYQTRLGQNVSTLINAGLKKDMYATQLEMVTEISNHINAIKQAVDEMIEERKKANNIDNMHQRANAYCDKVKPYFDTIRYHSDKLELAIEDGLWPLPKYREILFLK
jgi:glutamine synthetase